MFVYHRGLDCTWPPFRNPLDIHERFQQGEYPDCAVATDTTHLTKEIFFFPVQMRKIYFIFLASNSWNNVPLFSCYM